LGIVQPPPPPPGPPGLPDAPGQVRKSRRKPDPTLNE
jgi:hypothetical protein